VYHSRANVPHESLLRRSFPHVRLRRDSLHQQRPRGPHRPHDRDLPPDDQVHLLQVRRIGRHGEARRHVHPPIKRGEREDLHLPLVLVHHPLHPDLLHGDLPRGDHLLAADARLLAQDAIPVGADGRHRLDRAPEQDGRLVPLLHAGGERGLGHLQRRAPGAGQQAGQAQLPPHTRLQG
jgi:hypothetical protein